MTPSQEAAALCLHPEAGIEAPEHCCHRQCFQVFAQRHSAFRCWIKPINSNKIYSVGTTFPPQSQLPTEVPHKRGSPHLELANKASARFPPWIISASFSEFHYAGLELKQGRFSPPTAISTGTNLISSCSWEFEDLFPLHPSQRLKAAIPYMILASLASAFAKGQGWMGCWEEILPCEGGLEQPGTEKSVPALGKGWNELEGPFPTQTIP